MYLTSKMQIQSEYEGVKKFKLDPSKGKEAEEIREKADDAVASKSTTAKRLEEIAAKKSVK